MDFEELKSESQLEILGRLLAGIGSQLGCPCCQKGDLGRTKCFQVGSQDRSKTSNEIVSGFKKMPRRAKKHPKEIKLTFPEAPECNKS